MLNGVDKALLEYWRKLFQRIWHSGLLYLLGYFMFGKVLFKNEAEFMLSNRFLFIYFILFILAAGCSAPCVDCIPSANLPHHIHDNGVTYVLIRHESIHSMIAEETGKRFTRSVLIDGLEKEFPNNHELIDSLEERKKRPMGGYLKNLEKMKEDLEKSRGEFYFYTIFGENKAVGDGNAGIEVEEGWLILSHGKVIKKYIGAAGTASKDLYKLGSQENH